MRKSCPNSLSFPSFCQTGSMKQGDVTSPFYHCLYRVHVKLHNKSPLLENNLHVAQSQAKLLTLPEHMISPPIFSELRVTRSFALRLVYCRQTFVLLFVFFSFGHCVVCSSSIYGFCLPPLISSNSSQGVRVVNSIFSFMCSVLQIDVCSFVFFSFGHCIVCPSSIYGF